MCHIYGSWVRVPHLGTACGVSMLSMCHSEVTSGYSGFPHIVQKRAEAYWSYQITWGGVVVFDGLVPRGSGPPMTQNWTSGYKKWMDMFSSDKTGIFSSSSMSAALRQYLLQAL